MHCTRNVTSDLIWVGANDRRLAMFEGVYSVPNGVSYNSYLLMDEKTVLFDTVDKAVVERFIENVAHVLNGRNLDYLIVQHMEPDHSAGLQELIYRYPNVQVVCNAKTLEFINQFTDMKFNSKVVTEQDTISTGRHNLHFVNAPMVHWPEVMVTYDSTDKILFSADAFGTFGALNGALFADEVDFNRDYMDEARRYYTNIVGKYGAQVQNVLKKASALDIKLICPLHGFVWRDRFGDILSKYLLWSSYEPEEKGVMIAYASVYGNTENAAEILAVKLRERGIKTVMFDVSVTHASEVISAAFKYSHFVFASTTYNAGIFIAMEEFLSDLVAHNIQNRTVAIIENGTWAATSGDLMRAQMAKCANMKVLDQTLSIKSSVKKDKLADIEAIAEAIAEDFPKPALPAATAEGNAAVESTVIPADIDTDALFKISYGLFVLTARDGDKDNGCIINAVTQITDNPLQIAVTVNKANHTHDIIAKTGKFNISTLTQSVPFSVFEHFGFKSGKDTDKFADVNYDTRTANGIRYIPANTNSVVSGKVVATHDHGTHSIFIAEVTQANILTEEPSVTYQYYFDKIKPQPSATADGGPVSGFVCKICGFVYEGETLPSDYICPLCKHGVVDFEKL